MLVDSSLDVRGESMSPWIRSLVSGFDLGELSTEAFSWLLYLYAQDIEEKRSARERWALWGSATKEAR